MVLGRYCLLRWLRGEGLLTLESEIKETQEVGENHYQKIICGHHGGGDDGRNCEVVGGKDASGDGEDENIVREYPHEIQDHEALGVGEKLEDGRDIPEVFIEDDYVGGYQVELRLRVDADSDPGFLDGEYIVHPVADHHELGYLSAF